MGVSLIFPCAECGAPDSRDEAHQQGCPTLEPLSDAQIARIYQNVVRLWAEDGERRAERKLTEARAEAALEYQRYLQARRKGKTPPNSFERFRLEARAELRRMRAGRMSNAELFRMYQQEFNADRP